MPTRRRFLVALSVALVTHAVGAYAVFSAYYPVRPALVCVMPLGDGSVAAYFSYFNEEEEPFTEPVGEDNYFSPGEPNRGQPTVFEPGAKGAYPNGAVVVTFKGDALTWHLGPREAVATRDSPRCPLPTTFRKLDEVTFQLPKPKPEPPPKPPEPPKPKPEPPKPEPPKPEPPKPEAKKEPTRKAKNYIKKKGQPKPKRAPKRANKADAPKSEPAPLVLTGLTKLGKGVAVQTADVDILGRPDVKATRENTNVEVVDDPDAVPDKVGDGTGGAPPKRVPPRVKKRVSGSYPEDAPRLGRTVLVKLSLKVGTDGRVKTVRVVKGAGAAFDREAKRVGRLITFYPATVNGEPVEQWVPWVVEFTPDEW